MITSPSQAVAIAVANRQQAQSKRQAKVIALHVAGLTRQQIADQLGVTRRTVYRDLADAADDRVDVEQIIEDSGVDATDAWIKLSKCFDADLRDVFNDDWSMKPLAEWPEVWRTGLAGEIKIEDISERSHDGATKDKDGGWDQVGKRVTLKRESLLKIIELAGRLKPVDAFVQQKAGDTNVVVITADRARQVQAARRRVDRVVNVTATSIEDGPAGVDALRAMPQAQGEGT